MQTKTSNINDMFAGTGDYPLEYLSKQNRWVKLSDALDWNDIEKRYNERLNNQQCGAGNKPAQMVIGAMIVKHMTRLSDEETIMAIQENPFMQYLVGLKYFRETRIFTPELFVTLRKRVDETFFNDILASMHRECIRKSESGSEDNGPDGEGMPTKSSVPTELAETPGVRKGLMKIDATCTDAEVQYPVDINILEDCSREIDRLVQKLCTKAEINKPTSSRAAARQCYVHYIKQSHKGKKLVRETKQRLLHLLSKDIQGFMNLVGGFTSDVLRVLNRRDIRNLQALRKAYEQQKEMFDNDTRSCANRIISIFQPHVRPIVRGKAGRKVEFGAKIGVSVKNGFSYIDHLSWDAYNESSDLVTHLRLYKQRFGYYPEEVQADKLYLNKTNRRILRLMKIKCHCPALGRPPKHPDPLEKELRRKASASRNEVEGSFGTGKRVYGANDIRAKLPETARSWIGACFFVKNLKKFLRGLLCVFSQIFDEILSILRLETRETHLWAAG